MEKKAKGADPISDRARALNEQIAALESQIKKLDSQLQQTVAPKFRSTALPHGATISRRSEPAPAPTPIAHEPVFEEIKPVSDAEETAAPDQFNELGVRKYDLPAFLNRFRRQFSRPEAGNSRLVTYLAAGGVRGLRPLRYEKRIARRRFILFAAGLFLLMLGVIWVYSHH